MRVQMLPQEMQDALVGFDARSESFLKSFLTTVEKLDTPDIIYHYTNDVGLRGILETGQIWLSDIFYLNDPSELRHGVSLAVDILNRKTESGPPESKIFARHFTEFFKSKTQETAHYFVCSFSLNGDDLGQWRAYADNGQGYALGFDAKLLEGAFTKANGSTSENSSTFRVTYDDEKLIGIHEKIIDSMIELISLPRGKQLDSAIVSTYMKELSVSLSLVVLRAALFFKHKAYQLESEFRFLQIFRRDLPPPDTKCRQRSYELVKYREFAWRDLHPGMLKKIMVGPAADRVKARHFAMDCLEAFHPGDQGDVEIDYSDIPYRAFR